MHGYVKNMHFASIVLGFIFLIYSIASGENSSSKFAIDTKEDPF